MPPRVPDQLHRNHSGRYGWQRDGGHADLLLTEERDLLVLPQSLTYLDGAVVACGFGTAYEALCRVEVSGRDRVLVTGLGPVGSAVGLLAKKMGRPLVVGTDPPPPAASWRCSSARSTRRSPAATRS